MTKKITLSASRDIPLDKLVLAASNVRHIRGRDREAVQFGQIAGRWSL